MVEPNSAHGLQPVLGTGVLEQDPAVGGDRGPLVADGQVEPDYAEPRLVLIGNSGFVVLVDSGQPAEALRDLLELPDASGGLTAPRDEQARADVHR